MASTKQLIADRVNILLPMQTPAGTAGSALLGGLDGEWGTAEYAEARAAAAALEEQEISIEPASYELARAVLAALSGNPELRGGNGRGSGAGAGCRDQLRLAG